MKKRLRFCALCLGLCALITACRGVGGTGRQTETTLPIGSTAMTSEALTTEALSTAPPESYDYVRVSHEAFEHVTIHGRTLHGENGYHIEWPYAGFTLRGWFSGDIRMFYRDVEGYLDKTVLSVRVDGGESEQLTIHKSGNSILLATVSEGYHEITVRKGAAITAFRFVLTDLSYYGCTVKAESEKPLAIEVIGDSISNGVGAAQAETGTYRYLNGSNCMASFSGILAERLQADMNVLAMSGWGVSKGAESPNHRMPEIYSLLSPYAGQNTPWEFSSYQPDVVIIALGTNDYGSNYYALIRDVRNFLTAVRAQYPDAYIIWMYGMMGNAMRDPIRLTIEDFNYYGDERIRYVEVEADQSGLEGHPSEEAQRRYADILKEIIASLPL